MQIIGKASEARSLSEGITGKTKKIYELTKDISGQLGNLGNSFQDEGYEDLRNSVIGIYKSIEAHLDDVNSLKGALNSYAEVLEQK